jgi:putative transcriptional regulator
MGLQYKIDVLDELKSKGYTAYRLRKEKRLSESTIQKLRTGSGVSWENIETLCELLSCQPGDILEYIRETTEG